MTHESGQMPWREQFEIPLFRLSLLKNRPESKAKV